MNISKRSVGNKYSSRDKELLNFNERYLIKLEDTMIEDCHLERVFQSTLIMTCYNLSAACQ